MQDMVAAACGFRGVERLASGMESGAEAHMWAVHAVMMAS